MLDEILSRFTALPAEKQGEILAAAKDLVGARKFKPLPGPQTAAYFCKADVLLYGGQAGGGKGLSLDTQLPTPSGFTTMGAVRVGDTLFDQDGNQCAVTAVTGISRRACFEIEFDDGSVVVADDVHRWLTMTDKDRDSAMRLSDDWRARRRASRPSRAVSESRKPWVSESVTLLNREREHVYLAPPVPSIRTTADIAASVLTNRGRTNHSVDAAGAIDLPHAVLPIDPYLLGVWLGDGFSASGRIGMLSEDWADILRYVQWPIRSRKMESRTGWASSV
jgi:hypothetical protein